jgi:hypothetical protein
MKNLKCPYCEQKISVFSRTVNNLSNDKKCPNCNGKITTEINVIPFVIAIIIVQYLVDDYIIPHVTYDVPRPLVIGVVTGLIAALFTKLKSKN